MKVKLIVILMNLLMLTMNVFANNYSNTELRKTEDSIKAVINVIVESYINGIFLKGDYKLVKNGWHQDCDIVILENDKLLKLPAKYWVERLKKYPKPLDSTVTYEFTDIKITGYAAIAVVEIYSHGFHLYTDYMCLYKFGRNWKIVTKIYYTYPKNNN